MPPLEDTYREKSQPLNYRLRWIGMLRILTILILFLIIIIYYVSPMFQALGTETSGQLSKLFLKMVGLILIVSYVYYHLDKGRKEIQLISQYTKKRLQKFSSFYSILVLIILGLNLLQAITDWSWDINTIILTLLFLSLLFLFVIDVFLVEKPKNSTR